MLNAIVGRSGLCRHRRNDVPHYLVRRDMVEAGRYLRVAYVDRMATIGGTDAARRAGARLARIATSKAIAAPVT